jgi:hypothetical protein
MRIPPRRHHDDRHDGLRQAAGPAVDPIHDQLRLGAVRVVALARLRQRCTRAVARRHGSSSTATSGSGSVRTTCRCPTGASRHSSGHRVHAASHRACDKGQEWRPLHRNATGDSARQAPHRTRANPCTSNPRPINRPAAACSGPCVGSTAPHAPASMSRSRRSSCGRAAWATGVGAGRPGRIGVPGCSAWVPCLDPAPYPATAFTIGAEPDAIARARMRGHAGHIGSMAASALYPTATAGGQRCGAYTPHGSSTPTDRSTWNEAPCPRIVPEPTSPAVYFGRFPSSEFSGDSCSWRVWPTAPTVVWPAHQLQIPLGTPMRREAAAQPCRDI